MGYGTIRGVHVRAGDPQFSPPFQIVRTVLLKEGEASPRVAAKIDFVLKREHHALRRELAAISDGVIDVIKVHDGLPVCLEISEQP